MINAQDNSTTVKGFSLLNGIKTLKYKDGGCTHFSGNVPSFTQSPPSFRLTAPNHTNAVFVFVTLEENRFSYCTFTNPEYVPYNRSRCEITWLPSINECID